MEAGMDAFDTVLGNRARVMELQIVEGMKG
jgi:hypothetical protein